MSVINATAVGFVHPFSAEHRNVLPLENASFVIKCTTPSCDVLAKLLMSDLKPDPAPDLWF